MRILSVLLSFLVLSALSSCGKEPGPSPAPSSSREAEVSPQEGSAESEPGEGRIRDGAVDTRTVKDKTKSAIDRGLRYLRKEQTEDGSWQFQGHSDAGLTALALSAFFRSPRKYSSEDGPFIRKPLEYLASQAQDDGGIYQQGLANYVTCVSLMALLDSGEERYRPLIEGGQRFLKGLQADEGEGYSPSDKYYGGTGYGGDERPDLSNASLWFDTMKATGLPDEDEAYRKAMVFLNRCQNRSESNSEEWKDPRTGVVFASGDDGGAFYAPGNSPAGETEDDKGRKIPNSYGSMTYALLKCYLFAGLDKEDPRVKDLVAWVARNFTLEENPGFKTSQDGQQGLYYYYLNLARALEAYGEETLVDRDGVSHRWREELAQKLISLQDPEGWWVNPETRWWEGSKVLATSYAVLALEVCYPGLQ